ncbi:hypothetical protein M8494_06480 [Serratia ureilytica]
MTFCVLQLASSSLLVFAFRSDNHQPRHHHPRQPAAHSLA